MDDAKAEAEANKPEGDDTEIKIDPIYKDVELFIYWEMTVNKKETGIDTEIKPGDTIKLTFKKVDSSKYAE